MTELRSYEEMKRLVAQAIRNEISVTDFYALFTETELACRVLFLIMGSLQVLYSHDGRVREMWFLAE